MALSWLDAILFGVRRLLAGTSELPERPALKVTGAGATLTDDPVNKVTVLNIPGVTAGGGVIADSLVSGGTTLNDLSIGSAPVTVVRVVSATLTTITGISPPSGTPMFVVLICDGASSVVLKHQDTGSAAAARFAHFSAGDRTIAAGNCVLLAYDLVSTRWRIVGYPDG